ncbi:sigma factor-like helix-turn-helix DNA-binding protein [Oceanobacillus jeddahense]|uniref:sigma factor-like helix-turn-helix DNA-binding protein n=1 Tax=Oceanobacillus jeddahense TaxID=1462527 RepID=UPI000595DD9F|nr:sigma factor-like helix-turn-helix DNA-binding protein [Oceanobacillus jeddahense]
MCARPSTNRNEEDTFFHTMYRQLSHYCFFLSQNKWDGEELVQETLKKALISYGNPDSWNVTLLKKIAYHAWIDKNRRKTAETEYFVEEESEHKNNYEEIEALVTKLLSFMTMKQCIVFLMKDVFRYQINEIADNCGMSDTAVKAMLNRARKHIQNMKEEEALVQDDEIPYENNAESVVSVVVQVVKANDPAKLIQLIPEIFMTNHLELRLIHSTHRPSSYALSLAA